MKTKRKRSEDLTIEYSLNDQVWIKLTPEGKRILKAQKRPIPDEDSEGWSLWQMYVIMGVFGNLISINQILPFETRMQLVLSSGSIKKG